MTFLIEGEKVIKRFSQSRITKVKLYLAAAVLFLIPVIYFLYFSKVKLPFPDIYVIAPPAAIGFILILMAELETRLGSYYITNHRVISIRGAMKKTMDSCTYDKMVNVKVVQTFLQRILGLGTIDITTYQKTEIFLNSVSNPTKIEKLIYSAMEQQSQRQSGQQRAAEARPAQQPQYQPQPAPDQQPPYKPVPEQQPQYRPQYQRQPQSTPEEQSEYRPQSRPLLASERKLMHQPESDQQLAYQQMPEQQPQPQSSKKKRFKLF
jgi:DNA mismatch repair ATPase MutL